MAKVGKMESESDTALLDRLEKLEKSIASTQEENALLRREISRLERVQKNDPIISAQRSQEIVEKSKAPRPGRYRWEIQIPGYKVPCIFNSDFGKGQDRQAAEDWAKHFGTQFVQNSKRKSGNHTIRFLGENS